MLEFSLVGRCCSSATPRFAQRARGILAEDLVRFAFACTVSLGCICVANHGLALLRGGGVMLSSLRAALWCCGYFGMLALSKRNSVTIRHLRRPASALPSSRGRVSPPEALLGEAHERRDDRRLVRADDVAPAADRLWRGDWSSATLIATS